MTPIATWTESAHGLIEAALRKAVCSDRFVPKLRAALEYSIFPAGKRIRPVFALAVCSDLGGDRERILNPAVALELLHCSSLVHDDLPALDNDDMRRGKPSCHRAYGEATALLAGDLAVSEAIRLALESSVPESATAAIAEEVCLAYSELCNGQQLDLLPPSERGDIFELYSRKTGALFGAAFAIGAIGADQPASLVALARDFGIRLGVLFQLRDDRIDGEPEKGRQHSSDLKNEKSTASITEAPSRIEMIRKECIQKLELMEQNSRPLPLIRELALPLLAGS